MNELSELESGIEHLKRDSKTKVAVIDALEREKAELLRRSDELSERLRQASEGYRESFSKLTASVNSQVSQLKLEMTGLSKGMEGLSGLEQRLEIQEKSHEKSLARLDKELALVGKALSDVGSIKSELSRQKALLQDTSLQTDKRLQTGIAYVRKEMEVNRHDDARAALEEFKQELERIATLEKELNAYRRSQGARLDSAMEELSSLRSSLAELKLIKERTGSLEGLGGELESRVSELANRQKSEHAVIASELSKRLDKSVAELRKGLEARRSEDARAQLREFKQELERISSLEGGLNAHEKRLDKIAQELSSLWPTAEQVEALREKAEENLHMNQSLADRTVSAPDFERATKSISRDMRELETRFLSLEKRLTTDKGSLEKAIQKVLNEEKLMEGTQENIRKWFDAKQQDLEKRVSSGLDALTTQMEDGQSLVDGLRQKSQGLELMTREVPRKLDEHRRQITKLIDAKGNIAASLESLSGDIKNISGRLSSSLERVAGIEKGISSTDKSSESRFDRLSRDFSAYQQELKNINVLLREFSESGRLDVANLRAELGSSIKGLERDTDKKLATASASGLKELRDKTRGMASKRDLDSELSIIKSEMSQLARAGDFVSEVNALKSGLAALDSKTGEFATRVSKELKEFKKSVDSRLSGLSEEQAAQFKREFDFISKNIGSMRDLSSDIRVFKSKLADLERFSRTMLTQQDFTRFREGIEARMSGMEGLSRKSLDSLAKDLEEFKTRVESGKLSKADFSKSMELIETRLEDLGVMAKSSTGELRKDLDSFKKSVSGSLSEVRGSQTRELRDELKRLSRLEGEMKAQTMTNEERLDQISEALASLQAMPPEIGMLREKLDSLEKLSVSAVSGRDFSQRVSGINSALEKLHAGLTDIDKRLSTQEAGLDSAIHEVLGEDMLLKKTQDATNRLIDARIAALDKKLSSSVGELSRSLAQNSGLISQLKERVAEVRLVSEQSASSAASLEKLRERIAALEKGLSAAVASKEARLDNVSRAMESMDEKLDSSRKEVKEFREHIIQHVNDTMSSYDKRLGELGKGLSGRQIGSMEKAASEIEHLKSKLSEIDAMTKASSGGSVSESEFVNTVKAVSKRIDSLESLCSDIDKKASVHEAHLDSAVQKALSDDRLLKASQKHVRAWLESRINEIEERLSGDLESHSSRISDTMKEISSIREELASLRALGEHPDQEAMSRVGESLGGLEKSRARVERRLDSLTGELKSMNDRFIEEKGRLNTLEQKLNSSINTQQAKMREAISRQRADVSTEIGEEAARIMKDAELGELKRKHEFENLLKKFQELHIKTQQNLESVSRQREGLSGMEMSIKERIDRHDTSVRAKLMKSQERLKKRIEDAEGIIMKLNNMVSELQTRLESRKDVKLDFRRGLSELKDELDSRMKVNEEMFDSEMNAFKNRADSLESNLRAIRDIQENIPGKAPPKGTRQLEDLNKNIESLGIQLQSNRGEIEKFKEGITEYINNLVNTYEDRMTTIKRDIDYKLGNTKP